MSGQAIGMMEGAYFVGRVELLNWLNDFLQLDYKKIEQVCSASAYCQIMDALYPGKVPLSKVNFNAKFDYEYQKNFAILVQVFEKVGIDKRIDVNTLVKGKFQDNLEFCQWMKKYFDMHYGGDPYDAVGRRGGKTGAPASKSTPGGSKKVSGNIKTVSAMKSPQPKLSGGTPSNVKTVTPSKVPTKTTAKASPAAASGGSDSASNQRIQQLEQYVEELTTITSDVEKERDFYFGKLRDIEILCQNTDQNDLTEQIFKILSSSDDADGGEGGEIQEEEEPQEGNDDDETF